jgi:hypothetical protein
MELGIPTLYRSGHVNWKKSLNKTLSTLINSIVNLESNQMMRLMMKVDFQMGGVDSSSEESNFMNKKKFTKMVEDCVRTKSMTYMDTVVYLCEQNNLEIEDVKKYISPSVKEKIEFEAMKLNFLEKSESLPNTK